MRGIALEAKKTLFHPFLLISALLLLLVNGWMGADRIDRYLAEYSDDYLAAYDTLYSQIEGDITLDNMKWVVSEKQRLNQIIQGGQFPTEPNQSGTYTGYVFSDNNLVNQLYDDARYAYEYAAFAKGTADAARENVALYEEKGNAALVKRYTEMAQRFEGRKVTDFYRTDGWEEYFSYNFSNLPILLLLIVGLAPFFSRERETGMCNLLQLTPCGTRKARLQKLVLAFGFTWLVTTLFAVQDFLLFHAAYGFRGWGNPLYAIPAFQTSPLSVTIGGYLGINYAAKWLGAWVFASLVLLASALSSSDIAALVVSGVLFVGEILIGQAAPLASFLPLLNSSGLSTGFDLWNASIPRLALQAMVQGGIALACTALACAADCLRYGRMPKEVVR